MAFVQGKNGTIDTDKVYTPEAVAKAIISKYDLYGKVLDPFKGKGAFYDNYPDTIEKDWCEIDDGRDFFEYNEHVDWIVTNPPYSIYDDVMAHAAAISDNIVWLVPLNKIVNSMRRLRASMNYGGIKSIYYIASSKCNFPFGFPSAAVHFEKGYTGPTVIKELEV